MKGPNDNWEIHTIGLLVLVVLLIVLMKVSGI